MTIQLGANTKSILLGAYSKLTRHELFTLLALRGLAIYGSEIDIAERLATFDSQRFQHKGSVIIRDQVAIQPSKNFILLPLEIWVNILEQVNDWELARALCIESRKIKMPAGWRVATDLDHAVLSGSSEKVKRLLDKGGCTLSTVGQMVMIRFGYTHLLFLLHNYIDLDIIPDKASELGRVEVLEWWRKNSDCTSGYDHRTMDGASRSGHVQVLEWWHSSKLPLYYTEQALDHASARGHVHVLEWWKNSGLQLRIGHVMELASLYGRVEVLEWWLQSGINFPYDKSAMCNASCYGHINVLDWWYKSGLKLIYDREALVGATMHNQCEVLDWWANTPLHVEYRICDIEFALEDGTTNSKVWKWWENRGLDVGVSNKEWIETRLLN